MFTVQRFIDVLSYGLTGSDKMPRFRKGGDFPKQAKAVVLKNVSYGKKHNSRNSTRHDIANLANIGKYLEEYFKIKFLDDITLEMAHQYLNDRSEDVSQSMINQERRALLVLTKRPSSNLHKCKIEHFVSKIETNLSCRTYTPEQIDLLIAHQSPKHALSTKIAYEAGLRAHELLTIRRIEEQAIDIRNWSKDKYLGREHWCKYSVVGKGGLIRDIRLSPELAKELELFRRSSPVQVTDRGIYYQSLYDIGGGNNWSSSFTRASMRALGWSRGAHGTRHSYSQKRVSELQGKGLSHNRALSAVSSELGHMRADITLVYLR